MVSYDISTFGIYDVGTSGWNFKDETVGAITTISGATLAGGNFFIADSIADHAMVLHTEDVGGVAICTFGVDLTPQLKGAIEFYMMAKDDRVTANIGVATLKFDFPDIIVHDDTGDHDTGDDFELNKWYRCGIAWRATGGAAYSPWGQALAETECLFMVNDTLYGPYTMDLDTSAYQVAFYAGNAERFAVDAIAHDWDATYTLDDNKSLVVGTAITAANVYDCMITHKVMSYPVAEMSISEDEVIGLGTIIKVTDNFSIGGATASNDFCELEVVEIRNEQPYKLILRARGASDLENIVLAGDRSGRSDEIVTDIIGDFNIIQDGTHENGTAMGTRTYSGFKTTQRCLINLAKFEGSLWYAWYDSANDVYKINFNDMDTDTAVDFDETSNINLLRYGRPRVRYTQVLVAGGSGASGSATASAQDLINYGTNPFPHQDSLLTTDALCNTCAANLLAALNNDIIMVEFEYSISGVGFIQPGQTVTFSYSAPGMDDILEFQGIVIECKYDPVNTKGTLLLASDIYYDSNINLSIEENAANIGILETGAHQRLLSPDMWFPEQGLTSGATNVYIASGYVYFGTTSKTNSNYLSSRLLLPDDYVTNSDIIFHVVLRDAEAADTIDYTITMFRHRHSETATTEDTESSTFTTEGANEFTHKEFTLSQTNGIQAGDVLDVYLYMEDDSNTNTLLLSAVKFEITVNGRD